MKKILDVANVVDVHCDRCGNTCKVSDGSMASFEYATVSAYWGYLSRRDLDRCEAHLCEDCFEAFDLWMAQGGGGTRVRTRVLHNNEYDMDERVSLSEAAQLELIDSSGSIALWSSGR